MAVLQHTVVVDFDTSGIVDIVVAVAVDSED
jgi:hypothetical protein